MAIQVNNKAALLGFVGIIGIIVIYLHYPSKESDNQAALQKNSLDNNRKESLLKKLSDTNSRSGNMNWEELKSAAKSNAGITSTEVTVEVGGTKIFKREAVDSKKKTSGGTILFLHGQAFTSENWCKLGTLNVTAHHGYKAIAIDLPDYGQSAKGKTSDSVQFMLDLLKVLGLDIDKPIIVSPSMSGGFALPLLFQHPEAFKGYIPVAPVGVGKFNDDEYKNNKVFTCSIVGDKDPSLGAAATAKFSQMPNGETHTLEDAGHPCYLDQPQEFHNIMYAFAKKVFGA
ncbi:putative protein-lysine deacylase ABHD14B isoform X1 [Amphiura filiformis]|uniref:putative protein-lysine deacylase ABHD14B isoform X1 n=1 Tax=Amphiura filiformis TaxID=82378 RepID=UPI003B21724E